MNEFKIEEVINELEMAFNNLLYLHPEEYLKNPNSANLTKIKDALNKVCPEKNCTDVIYTLNTDKPYFGIKVNPIMSANQALSILADETPVVLNRYQIEIDSKLLESGLNAEEITAITIFEFTSMMSDNTIDQVRALIDLKVLSDDDYIRIRESANYNQLIIFALKDTMFKVSSILFKEDVEDLRANEWIKQCNLEDALMIAQEKILASLFGEVETLRTSKTIILQWMFTIYKDMKHNSRLAIDALKDARDFTGSVLEKQEIDKTLISIDRIDTQTIVESLRLDKYVEKKGITSLSESLFKSLKQRGLKSLESEYYELTVRAKAAETENDVLYVIRAINTRLSILEDYIYSQDSDVSEAEIKRYSSLAMQYRDLREYLAKKKLSKKQYGIFIDYDALPED